MSRSRRIGPPFELVQFDKRDDQREPLFRIIIPGQIYTRSIRCPATQTDRSYLSVGRGEAKIAVELLAESERCLPGSVLTALFAPFAKTVRDSGMPR